MDSEVSQTGPTALADLVAAGLVSHAVIADPARVGGETACLHALCALVGGSIYRVGVLHYAFRAGPSDLEGRLADLEASEWTAALDAALAARLGAGAVRLEPVCAPPSDRREDPARPLMFLRAYEGAVTDALAGEEAMGLQAVIDAGYATQCARLSAGAEEGGPLAGRLDEIETRQAEILARLEAQGQAEAVLDRFSETLAGVVRQLDAQAGLLHEHVTREDRGAAEIEALRGRIEAAEPAMAAFQDRLGVTLAEFLARLEQRGEAERASLRVPHFS